MFEYSACGKITDPALIFLHGFLGSKEDWDPIIEQLKDRFFCVALELSGHPHLINAVETTLQGMTLNSPTLIGYSMGGRIAMQLPLDLPKVILSSHLGLETLTEREARWEKDLQWIGMLENGPIDLFLDKWYAQPLFASLRNHHPLFEQVLMRRRQQDPLKLASLLKEMSLAKQQPISQFPSNMLFLFGENDLQYEKLYCKLPNQVRRKKIPQAGHAAHLENPDACAETIEQWSLTHGNN